MITFVDRKITYCIEYEICYSPLKNSVFLLIACSVAFAGSSAWRATICKYINIWPCWIKQINLKPQLSLIHCKCNYLLIYQLWVAAHIYGVWKIEMFPDLNPYYLIICCGSAMDNDQWLLKYHIKVYSRFWYGTVLTTLLSNHDLSHSSNFPQITISLFPGATT